MPSPYERKAWEAIQSWHAPRHGVVRRVLRVLDRPFERAAQVVLDAPALGGAIESAVARMLELASDAASSSLKQDTLLATYRAGGHGAVRRPGDVLTLDLEVVDRLVGRIAPRYRALALAEGVGCGAMGPVGAVLDVFALATLNLRAIGEYATYCGFDISREHERMYAVHVLGYASSPDDPSRAVAKAQLSKLAKEVTKREALRDLERFGLREIRHSVARTLGVRLSRVRAASIVPYANALVGGGFNAHFTAGVCRAAYFLYRERFLWEKYGSDVSAAATACPPLST